MRAAWKSIECGIGDSFTTSTCTLSPTYIVRCIGSTDRTRNGERRSSSQTADENCLQRASKRTRAGESSLHVAKDEEGEERECDRDTKGFAHRCRGHVRHEGNEAAHDVRRRNRQRAPERSFGIRRLEPELEAHHEIAPGRRTLTHRADDRCRVGG